MPLPPLGSQTILNAFLNQSGTNQGPSLGAASEHELVKCDSNGKIDVSFLDTAGILGDYFRADFVEKSATAPVGVATMPISDAFKSEESGGMFGVEGLATSPPENIVNVKDQNRDDFLDADGNRIFGRATGGADVALTGAVTLTNGLTAMAGAGTLFLAELQVGDIVTLDSEAPAAWAEVQSITDNFNAVLSVNYGGVGGSGGATVRSWTLSFYSFQPGFGEVAYAGFAGEALTLFPLKVYSLENLPVFPAYAVLPSDQVAGTIPDADETTYGKVVFALHSEESALEAVQSDDPRLKYSRDVVLSRIGTTNNQFIKLGEVFSNLSGYRVISSGTLRGVSAQNSNSANTYTAEIKVNGATTDSLVVTSPALGDEDNTLSTAISAGDIISVYCSGTADNLIVNLTLDED